MNLAAHRPGRAARASIAAAAVAASLGLVINACEQNGVPPPANAPTPSAAPAPSPAAARPAPAELYKVPLGDSPARGGAQPKVTLVVFSEFQCPFCAKVGPTIEKVIATYGDEVRVVWKHLPLAFHDRAEPAARAAEAAREQGKFWQMHDRLFANQRALGAEDLERHAKEVGLDVARFRAALDGSATAARVDADRKLAAALGVNGTPTFFVNGRRLTGAQPFESFRTLIDEELARADKKLAAGVGRDRLYLALIEGGLEKAPPGAGSGSGSGKACPGGGCPQGPGPGGVPAAAGRGHAEDETIYKMDIGGSPTRGPADAPVTLVIFSDFQCGFCKKVEATVQALEQQNPGKVRVVWKNFPLAFHEHARPAAVAALAAHAQGKFWQMHEKLLANQDKLDRASLEGYARELGLDVARFSAALDPGSRESAAIDADMKLAASAGVTGTPTMFLNGRKLVGAQPLPAFKKAYDEALARR